METCTLTQSSLGPVSFRVVGTGARKLLFFHGFPGSSSQIALFNSNLKKFDLQVLCFDRPGYNLTNIQTNRMLKDTIQISEELITQLKWGKVEVICLSGGTPYGISFAQQRPQLVSVVRVVCGLGYLHLPAIRKYFSFFSLTSMRLLRFVPGRLLQKIIVPNPRKKSSKRSPVFELFYPTSKADQEIILSQSLSAQLDSTLAEAMNLQGRGPKLDTQVFFSDWGSQLNQFTAPIRFWHGDEDLVISIEVSKIMSNQIPHARFTMVSGEGHISLPTRRLDDILAHKF